MDNLDKLSVFFIVVLIVSLVVLSMDYQERSVDNLRYATAKSRSVTGECEIPQEKIKMLEDLIAANNIQKAEAILGELMEEYPYEGEPHILMGDIMMKREDAVMAMHAYRRAVDLNLDYVDKKTPLFRGRKIKNALNKAKGIIDDALAKRSDDRDMKEAKKTMYYLLRRLAGSCG